MVKVTYDEAKNECKGIGLHLADIVCPVELIELIDNTYNVSGDISVYYTKSYLFFVLTIDRESKSHFISLKKNGTKYQDSDGVISEMAKYVENGTGDCVTYKNGSLYAAPCDQPAYYICENE
jgi:hypothetical protein